MKPRQRAQATDQRAQQPGEQLHRGCERQRDALVEAQRQRFRCDLAEDQHDDRQHDGADRLRDAAQVAADEQCSRGRHDDHRDGVEREDRRQVAVRVRVQASDGACALVAVLCEAPHPDPAHTRERRFRRRGKGRDDEAGDDDDDKWGHRLEDGGGSEPLTGTVRSRSVPHARARSPRRSVAQPTGCGAWERRRS